MFSRINGPFEVLKNGFAKVKLMWYTTGYFLHLWIRMLHDKTYESVPVYKKYSDQGYSHTVHKATLTAFVVSLCLFMFFQYAVPSLFNLIKPNQAYAGQDKVTLTNYGDFKNADIDANVSRTGTVDADNSSLSIKSTTNLGTGVDGDLVVDGNTGATITNSSTYPSGFTLSRAMNSTATALVLDTEITASKQQWNFKSVTLRNNGYITQSVQSGGGGSRGH